MMASWDVLFALTTTTLYSSLFLVDTPILSLVVLLNLVINSSLVSTLTVELIVKIKVWRIFDLIFRCWNFRLIHASVPLTAVFRDSCGIGIGSILWLSISIWPGGDYVLTLWVLTILWRILKRNALIIHRLVWANHTFLLYHHIPTSINITIVILSNNCWIHLPSSSRIDCLSLNDSIKHPIIVLDNSAMLLWILAVLLDIMHLATQVGMVLWGYNMCLHSGINR